MEEKKINWGITNDLQTDIRYEPNACKGYVLDLALGCPFHCVYCIFSELESKVYKLNNPEYNGEVVPLEIDNLLKRTEFPPSVYLSYSSDPLGNSKIKKSLKKVMLHLFEHNVNILFISKGVFDNDIIDIIKLRPDLLNIQIDLTSNDSKRNRIVEPGAPTYEERLNNIRQLVKINELGSLVVRMDPLLPNIDDNDKNLIGVLDDIKKLGVKEIVCGYMILTNRMKKIWEKHEYLQRAVVEFTEKTPTISKKEVYSIPFNEKVKRLEHIKELCDERNLKFSVCGCKDERFKSTKLEWICHPFNRKKREELNKLTKTNLLMRTEHLI